MVYSRVAHLRAMTALFDAGADPDLLIDNYTALTAAASTSQMDAMRLRLLLTRGAHVNAADGVALQLACLAGNLKVVSFLMDHGADSNQVRVIRDAESDAMGITSALLAAVQVGILVW